MRTVDLQSWPRREHFETYRDAHLPHFNMCADVDLTETRRALDESGIPITAAIVYVTARAANDIPEFRHRIRTDSVVEHEVVHPASTVMVNGGLFSFCFFDYTDDFGVFAKHYGDMTAQAKANPTLSDPPGRDDLLFMTAIPWVSFTSFAHPIVSIPIDSIPRFAWGRFRCVDGSVMMPLSVQGHHSLMDGLHMGRYYERVQTYFGSPDWFVG
jgi:chloramphenicol O-acetyltransferase type A